MLLRRLIALGVLALLALPLALVVPVAASAIEFHLDDYGVLCWTRSVDDSATSYEVLGSTEVALLTPDYMRGSGHAFLSSQPLSPSQLSGYFTLPTVVQSVLVSCGGSDWVLPLSMSRSFAGRPEPVPVNITSDVTLKFWLEGYTGYDTDWNERRTYLRSPSDYADELASFPVSSIGGSTVVTVPVASLEGTLPVTVTNTVSVDGTVAVSNMATPSSSYLPTISLSASETTGVSDVRLVDGAVVSGTADSLVVLSMWILLFGVFSLLGFKVGGK